MHYRRIGESQWLRTGPPRAPPGDNVWTLIRTRLADAPERVALCCGGHRLSAAVLAAEVEAFPWPSSYRRVGVRLKRSAASVVATLAAWRHGAAYVPIGAESPHARVASIATSCALDLLLTSEPLALPGYRALPGISLFGETLHRLVPEDAASPPAIPALCYIAQTSGSTGNPKGVMIPHAALLNRLAAMRDLVALGGDDVCLYKTSASFDVHVWEFTLPLVMGARLVVYAEQDGYDLGAVGRLICDEGVSVVGFVPVLLRGLLRSDRFREGNRLRAIFCGGEAWAPSLARAVHAGLPGRALYNSYGPTETTLAVSNWLVPDDEDPEQILLGDPLDNTVFLVEADTPFDHETVSGRLLIGGPQLAIGYVQKAGDARFVERLVDDAVVRFYDTGDLVRLATRTGALVFAGRADEQVKVNGVRIELAEIEETVGTFDGIEHAACFLNQAGALCLAYVTDDATPRDPKALAAFCARTLPSTLIPSRFRHMTTLPLTASGKLDRKALATAA